MIARIWRGVTRAAHADEYLAYLNATGLPAYRATPGNRGVRVLRRITGAGDDAQAEFYPDLAVGVVGRDPPLRWRRGREGGVLS